MGTGLGMGKSMFSLSILYIAVYVCQPFSSLNYCILGFLCHGFLSYPSYGNITGWYWWDCQWNECQHKKRNSNCSLREEFHTQFSLFQLLSHVQLCDPMDCSMSGFPVHYQLPELAQTHVHQIGDAIQPSHPPSPPTFSLAQHQDLFQGVSSSYQVAKVLEFQLQHQSFQWTFRTDFL